ncbi:MAG: glycosyltransferase family 2 protein [Actinomycetota bacterium]
MSRVSVVIPNWNGMAHLETCMRALEDQTFRDFEVIVADNGSTDDSRSYLRRRWPDATIVELGANKGFPAAVNAGIEVATGSYVVLLNNDTKATPSWLERLVAAMDASPGHAWGSSKLLRFDEPDVIDSAGHTYSLWVGAAHNVGEGQPADAFSDPRRVFGATAAASIYRRSLFADIGAFDAEFFLVHEDTEFDLRANIAGHRCLYVPDAVIFHKRGASYEVAREIHLMGVRNRIWTTRTMPPGIVVLWFATKALRAFRWIPAKLLGRRTSARSAPSAWRDVSAADVLRASLAALRSLPRKRREVASVRRLNSVQVLRLLSETRSDARSNQ